MKKFLSVAISILILLFAVSPSAFAASIGEEYTFVFEDGTQINYYLDSDGLPYVIRNGIKVYAAIPLEQFIITDENLLRELNAGLPSSQPGNISPMAVPTSYYDLTKNPKTQESNHYKKYMNFKDTTTISTQNLKIHTAHDYLYYRASNVKPLVGNKSVKVTVYLHMSPDDTWRSYTYSIDNISEIPPVVMLYSSDDYAKLLVYSASAKVSFDLDVFTSYHPYEDIL